MKAGNPLGGKPPRGVRGRLPAVLMSLAVVAAVWFVGPLIAIGGFDPLASEISRLALILCVFIVAWISPRPTFRLGRVTRGLVQFAFGYFAITAGVLLVVAWGTSYYLNMKDIERMEGILNEYDKITRSLPDSSLDITLVLPPLDALRAVANEYGEDAVPWYMGFGLYQGVELNMASRAAYIRELNRRFAPAMAMAKYIGERLTEVIGGTTDDEKMDSEGEQATRAPSGAKLNLAELTLKAYLMFGNPETLNKVSLEKFVDEAGEQTFIDDMDARAQLDAHFSALIIGGLEPVPLDQELVARVRRWIGDAEIQGVGCGK